MDDKDKAPLKYDMNNTVWFTVMGGKYQEFATQYPNFPFFKTVPCMQYTDAGHSPDFTWKVSSYLIFASFNKISVQ